MQRKQTILIFLNLSLCRDDNEYTEQELLTELQKALSTTAVMMMTTTTKALADALSHRHVQLRLLLLLLGALVVAVIPGPLLVLSLLSLMSNEISIETEGLYLG